MVVVVVVVVVVVGCQRETRKLALRRQRTRRAVCTSGMGFVRLPLVPGA